MNELPLAFEIRCAARDGKCRQLIGRAWAAPTGGPFVLFLDNAPSVEGTLLQAAVPAHLGGGTDILWCPQHRHATHPGSTAERVRYSSGLGAIHTPFEKLRPTYERWARTGRQQLALMLAPPEPVPGVPQRPPKRGRGKASTGVLGEQR